MRIARAGHELYVSADRIAQATGPSRDWLGLARLVGTLLNATLVFLHGGG